eukprot:3570882-Alexandrium_andersonii.AAC.1
MPSLPLMRCAASGLAGALRCGQYELRSLSAACRTKRGRASALSGTLQYASLGCRLRHSARQPGWPCS